MLSFPHPIPDLLQALRQDPHPVLDGSGKDIYIARAPGRLDIMGGIADYTGSLVCQMPLEVGAAVAVQRRDDRKLVLATYNGDGGYPNARVELSLDDFYGSASLIPAPTVQAFFTGSKHWAAYIAGAYWILPKHRKLNRRIPGANIVCLSTVPMGGGVSSSAALEVAAMSALTGAYHLSLEPLELAVMAQRVENQIVGAPCGVMDQVASNLGRAGYLLLLRCQPHTIEGYLPFPAGVQLLGINSNVEHSVGGSAYRETRVAAFMAQAIIAHCYKDLGMRNDPTKGYLANVSPVLYRSYFRRILPRRISGLDFTARYGATIDRSTTVDPRTVYHVRDAADHHVLENHRVTQFVQALRTAGDGNRNALIRAGRLMLASHASYGQRAHMGSKETDLLVRLVMRQGPKRGFFGAKITGGGSGGTVAVLCERLDDVTQHLQNILTEYCKQSNLEAKLLIGTSPGASETPPVKLTPASVFA